MRQRVKKKFFSLPRELLIIRILALPLTIICECHNSKITIIRIIPMVPRVLHYRASTSKFFGARMLCVMCTIYSTDANFITSCLQLQNLPENIIHREKKKSDIFLKF